MIECKVCDLEIYTFEDLINNHKECIASSLLSECEKLDLINLFNRLHYSIEGSNPSAIDSSELGRIQLLTDIKSKLQELELI